MQRRIFSCALVSLSLAALSPLAHAQAKTSLRVLTHSSFDLPKDLRHLTPGFHEVFREHLSYHAMVEVVDGRHYVLLQDQSDFEERERVLFAVVVVGFVLSLALAVFLGWVLARKVMAPVLRSTVTPLNCRRPAWAYRLPSSRRSSGKPWR